MNGGSLSMLKYEEVVNRAAQLILDHQEHSQVRQQFLKHIRITKVNTEQVIAQHKRPFGGGRTYTG